MKIYRGLRKSVAGIGAILVVVVGCVLFYLIMPPLESFVEQYHKGHLIRLATTSKGGGHMVSIYFDSQQVVSYEHADIGTLFREDSPEKVFHWDDLHKTVHASYRDQLHSGPVTVKFSYNYETQNWTLEGMGDEYGGR